MKTTLAKMCIAAVAAAALCGLAARADAGVTIDVRIGSRPVVRPAIVQPPVLVPARPAVVAAAPQVTTTTTTTTTGVTTVTTTTTTYTTAGPVYVPAPAVCAVPAPVVVYAPPPIVARPTVVVEYRPPRTTLLGTVVRLLDGDRRDRRHDHGRGWDRHDDDHRRRDDRGGRHDRRH